MSRTIDRFGNIFYRNELGRLHRLDGPAYEDSLGNKAWHVNDKLHRLDGPAIEYPGSQKAWWVYDKRHRLDGPAIEWSNGSKEWYTNGKRHRLDGPAIEYKDGYKAWYIYSQIGMYVLEAKQLQSFSAFLKLTLLQNKSRKFNEWLFDPDCYAGRWHKKNMLRDFQV